MGGIAHAIAENGGVSAEVFEEHARVAQMAEHEAWLVKIAQAAAQSEPIEPFDYTRDIRTVLRQKLLHAAAMMKTTFCFHPGNLLSPDSPRHGLRGYSSVLSARTSVPSVFQSPPFRLRRQPR